MSRSFRLLPLVVFTALMGSAAACGPEPEPSSSSTMADAAATISSSSPSNEEGEPVAGGIELAADTTDGLVDQQELTVTSTGAAGMVWVVQCDANDLRVCWTGTPETFDSFGILIDGETTIDVRRIIPNEPDVDCAEHPGRCVLRLASGDEVALVPGSPSVPLTFDPDVPTRSTLQLTVTPHTDLVDGQRVVIEVANLPDDAPSGLGIQTCTVEDVPRCVWTLVSDDPAVDGVITARQTISRILVDPTGGFEPVDCGTAPCAIRVRYPGSPLAEVPLGFDPEAPAPEIPTLQLVATDDPRTVQVVGRGLTPGRGLTIMVCLEAEQACETVVDPIIAPDPAGRIDATITLPERSQGVACVPGSCAISVVSSDPMLFVEPEYDDA